MKAENGGMKKKSINRVARTQSSEKKPGLNAQQKINGWSGENETPREHLLAKTYISLKEIPGVRSDLIYGLEKEINAGTYEVPVEALAKILIPKFQIYPR